MSGHGTFVSYPAVTEDRIVPYLQPMMVAFDPEDPNLIVAGGYNSGVFLSADGGATWSLLTDPFTHGMSGIPYLPRPMFASFDHNKPGFVRIYLGTGRGIWRVEVALADLQITKTDLPDPAIAGESLTYTITVANNGPSNASDVTVHDILPADVDYAGSSGSCSESSPRMLSCTIGILAVGAQTSFTVTVNVPPNLVYLNGGPKTITNSATVSSGDIDPNLSNNTASEDTLVKAEADAAIVSFAAVAPPLEVLIGQPVDLTLRKVITNHGPSSPVDVNISRTATAPPGSTVTPAAFSETAPAVAQDELRTIDEPFAITCRVLGAQTFSFANAIQLANSTDLDPDLTNNTAAAAVTVECIVPVRIDIEPAVINLKSDGVVPVVVFANKAGEFGLPLAFDPATINVASVHFGPREIVWLDKGGSDETHDKDHGNSSRQRLFHFRVDESSLTSGLLEVCLKGLWLDPNGVSHTFFGCDTVLVK